MLLAIDIGNTNISLGIFDGENFIKNFRQPSNKDLSIKEYQNLLSDVLKNYVIKDCIIASVVNNLDKTLKQAIDNIFNINSLLLSNKLNLGMNLKLKNPHELGADRIANACGASKLYPKPALIVDIGSATTFDIIDKDDNFIGGLIMTGLGLQLKALNNYTSKLPLLEPQAIDKVIANNTKDAILSGVIRGSACAIEGMIEQSEKEFGEKLTIIATGGDCELVSKYMSNRKFDYINPNLTLEGLKFLYKLNITNQL